MADVPVTSSPDEDKSFSYGSYYYETYGSAPYEHSELWTSTFGVFADGIVQRFAPRTVLDVGCAKGLLVQALRARGVEAWGIDYSSFAISAAADDTAPYVAVSSATEPLPEGFPSQFDLVVSLECLEHIDASICPSALDNLTSWSDTILFSSCPWDYGEASHVNTRAYEDWVAEFAARGFIRNFAVDTSFIMAWAFSVRRSEVVRDTTELVRTYERVLWQLRQNHDGARAALAQLTRELEAVSTSLRDYTDLDQSVAHSELIALHEELAAVYASPQWRLGGKLISLPRSVKSWWASRT